MKLDLDALKQRVGRKPFDARVRFASDYAPCPFHSGDSPKSMHLTEKAGVWLATCFSSCQKSWDAIDFVKQFDKVEFKEALTRLEGGAVTTVASTEKPKAKPMTEGEWSKWGRDLTPEDIERFAKSRKDKTASFQAFKALGCRVKGDYIGFPYRHPVEGNTAFDAIRLRHLDTKDFIIERGVSLHGLFNLDTVNALEDVYVVEGEPDVAIMEEAGFRAVSVTTGAQKKFDPYALQILNVAPRIFIVGDQDTGGEDPGQKCMDGLQKLLSPEKTFRVRFTEAKDVSELARKLGDGFAPRIDELREESLTPWVMKPGNVQLVGNLNPEPQRWVIDRMLPYGGLAMLSGDAGAQKSMFALFAAKAMTFTPGRGFRLSEVTVPAGQEADPLREADGKLGKYHLGEGFLGRAIPRDVPVLFLDRENPQSSVSERVFKSGLLIRDNFWYWGDWSQEAVPEPDDPRLLEFAAKQGYIIFDSLQDWYGDASEIDNTAMVALMHKFKHLARIGAGVLLLHHNAKYEGMSGKKQSRGGTAIQALTDMAIKAEHPDETNKSIVRLSEARFRMCSPWLLTFQTQFPTPEQPMYGMELVSDELVKDAVKREIAEKQAATEHKREAKRIAERDEFEKIDGILQANPKTSQRDLAEALGVTHPTAKTRASKAGWVLKDGEWCKESTSDESPI